MNDLDDFFEILSEDSPYILISRTTFNKLLSRFHQPNKPFKRLLEDRCRDVKFIWSSDFVKGRDRNNAEVLLSLLKEHK